MFQTDQAAVEQAALESYATNTMFQTDQAAVQQAAQLAA